MIFEEITGSVVILSKNGVYMQRKAYTRRNEVFIKHGSGYVGMRKGGTSVARLHVQDYDLGTDQQFGVSKTGRIVTKGHKDFKTKIIGNSDDDK